MKGKKILIMHSGVYVLPDEFTGSYREALMSMLEHHLLIEDGKLMQTMEPLESFTPEQSNVHGSLVTKQLSKIWKSKDSKEKFCGSMTLHEWIEAKPGQFVLVQKNYFEEEKPKDAHMPV